MYSHEELYTSEIFQDCEDEPTSPRRKSIEEKKEKTEDAVSFLPKPVEETKSSGTVKASLYWKYFRSGSNYFILFSVMITNIFAQVLYTGSDYWLNVWCV